MTVRCYQVAHFDVTRDGDSLVAAVRTVTRSANQTDIAGVLGLIAGTVEAQRGGFFDGVTRYRVHGCAEHDLRQLLAAYAIPRVTVEGVSDCTICLDFYADPPATEDETDWARRELGELGYQAKYRCSPTHGDQLFGQVTSLVQEHPLLRACTQVAAMPSSRTLGAAPDESLTARIARRLAGARRIALARLVRQSLPSKNQKDLGRDDDHDANQLNTMSAEGVSGATVLVIDDLMRDGSTLREAVRALRAAGAKRAYGLILAKERTGTRGYQFDN